MNPPAAQLIITLQADGQLNLNGPLPNKLLCLGMLEEAKHVLQLWHAEQAKTPIARVPALALDPTGKLRT